MLYELQIDFNKFLLSLSEAMDIASPRIASHQIRVGFIAWKLCLEAQLPQALTNKIYLGALLHDIGALSLEEKIKIHTGLAVLEEINPDTHCILGANFFKLSPLLKPSAQFVRYHHRKWMEWQDLGENLNQEYVLGSQLILLADEIERMTKKNIYILHQVAEIAQSIKKISGQKVHPDFIDVFFSLAHKEDFWLDLSSSRLFAILLHQGPFKEKIIYQEDIFHLAAIFRDVIDFKSRFTATHSSGVAACSVALAKGIGFSETDVNQIKIASYLHDLGKLAVPNKILEKPGKLTAQEFAIIKQHPYFTYSVLSCIENLDTIAKWAALHHEKLNGTGYPFHVKEEKISLGSRILSVADFFTALLEDRPYRKGMTYQQIKNILQEQVRQKALDKKVVELLFANYGEVASLVQEAQAKSQDVFNQKFYLDSKQR